MKLCRKFHQDTGHGEAFGTLVRLAERFHITYGSKNTPKTRRPPSGLNRSAVFESPLFSRTI